VRTAVLSDLHLGAASGADLLRRPPYLQRLLSGLEDVDRVVLLGDVVELRDRPLSEAIELSRPFFAALGDTVSEIVLVAGNHDHRLVEDWLERRGLGGDGPLELEQSFEPTGPMALLAAAAAGARVVCAYPGLWVAPGIYATHGHFLDRHLTVPTFERLGVAAVERVLGIPAADPDPLAPPRSERTTVEEYERVLSPVYSLLFSLAQAATGETGVGANPSARMWRMLAGGQTRASRLRGWLLGTVALPGAVGVANRLGLGPVRSDLSPGSVTRASLAAIGEVVDRLGIDASELIFGHTHRRGPLDGEPDWRAGRTRLWNTGSWVHSPTLLRDSAAESPYWPGTVAFVDDSGPPRLAHLLDELSREELAATG
jgi:Calcineurin-like phosphoesterase